MAIYKLGEIAKIINGSKPSSYEGRYRILGSGGYFGWTNKYKTDDYSIMLPRKGTMKIMWIEPKAWNVDTAFLITKVNQEKVLMKYLYYELKINSHWMEKLINSGTTRPATRLTEWRKLELSLPLIEEQQKIIDIIEPIENLLKQINNLRNKLLNLVLNLPFSDKKEKISHFLEPIKNKPKHIKQISAKVLNNQGIISKLEDIDTYKTNNFFTPKGSFVFCSIRTYLKKWGLIPYDADSNGTLFQFSIKNNITSLISFLMSNDSWEKFNLLSSGTKMPVIKKESFLNVELPLKTIEIHKIDEILISFNQLELKINLLKERLIQLLIK